MPPGRFSLSGACGGRASSRIELIRSILLRRALRLFPDTLRRQPPKYHDETLLSHSPLILASYECNVAIGYFTGLDCDRLTFACRPTKGFMPCDELVGTWRNVNENVVTFRVGQCVPRMFGHNDGSVHEVVKVGLERNKLRLLKGMLDACIHVHYVVEGIVPHASRPDTVADGITVLEGYERTHRNDEDSWIVVAHPQVDGIALRGPVPTLGGRNPSQEDNRVPERTVLGNYYFTRVVQHRTKGLHGG